MLSCIIDECSSNENSKIDGRNIQLFPFPESEEQKIQWMKNCHLNNITNKEKTLHICELHFSRESFTSSHVLKPDAVPTVSFKNEDLQRKRRADVIMQNDITKAIPSKQKKLDGPQENSGLLTQTLPAVRDDKDKERSNNIESETIKDNTDTPITQAPEKETKSPKPELIKEFEIGKKIYRLTIQIDKICGKPCPRSKKLGVLADLQRGKPDYSINTNQVNQENQSSQNPGRKTCPKGSCILRKAVYDSKQAYQCELCDKYYITKKTSEQEEKGNACTLCCKTFPSPQSLYLHVKSHFICDMCQVECTSQVAYDKHARLHVSTDPQFPYKCHQCTEIFELKEDVRQHCLIAHPTIKLQNTILQMSTSSLTPQATQQKEYRCTSCNVTFRNDQAYKNHVNSHKKKEGLRCNISDTNNIFPVPNPLTGSQIGILRAVKFSCRVCSMEFDNVGEVDRHTRTHLEDADEEHKCNICKKTFKSSTQFNEHLKNHLSRAHPCPICPKAFINRTTLKIHLKTHGES